MGSVLMVVPPYAPVTAEQVGQLSAGHLGEAGAQGGQSGRRTQLIQQSDDLVPLFAGRTDQGSAEQENLPGEQALLRLPLPQGARAQVEQSGAGRTGPAAGAQFVAEQDHALTHGVFELPSGLPAARAAAAEVYEGRGREVA